MASPQNKTDASAQHDAHDWEEIKKEAEAEIAALEALKQLIEAREALEAAQGSQDPTTEAIEIKVAAAEAATALSVAQKAEAEAAAAAFKAQVGEVPNSGYSGDVTLEVKAGTTEVALLAAKAVITAAQSIEEKIPPEADGKTILLYSLAEVPDFQALVAYRAQITLLDREFNDAKATSDEAEGIAPTDRAERETVPLAAAAGLALNAVNKLLGFFRTDYTVGGVDVSLEDSLLIHALAGLIAEPAKNRKARLPAVFNPGALSDSGTGILKEITDLSRRKLNGEETAKRHEQASAEFRELAEQETDDEEKVALLKKAEAHTKAADVWKTAIGFYDGFFSKLNAADDQGTVPFTNVISENEVFAALTGGDLLLIVRIQKSGGAYYTKKNMWTFFGGMPFYFMGGTVVSFVLLDGTAGTVVSSGVVPVDGGFVKAGKLQKELEPEQ